MADNSRIEWTDATWNMIGGCSPVSEGCANCYAVRDSWRMQHNPRAPERYRGVVEEVDGHLRWTTRINLDHDALDLPRRWTRPRRIFVASMSDLFHRAVPFEFVKRVWDVMAKGRRHTFVVLTKRPQRMLEFTRWMAGSDDISIAEWPRNVWLGVTAENQRRYNERVSLLLQIPAAVRFVSIEPMLGPVDLLDNSMPCPDTGVAYCGGRHLPDWVIVGGETGSGVRPMHPDWVRGARDQCQEASVPFFFKAWGDWLEVGMLLPEQAERHAKDQSAWPDGTWMFRVGKKVAGRKLDGITWDEMPAVAE